MFRLGGWLFALGSLPLSAFFSLVLFENVGIVLKNANLNRSIDLIENKQYLEALRYLSFAKNIATLSSTIHEHLPVIRAASDSVFQYEQAKLLLTVGDLAVKEEIPRLEEFAADTETETIAFINKDIDSYVSAIKEERLSRKIEMVSDEEKDNLLSRYKQISMDLDNILNLAAAPIDAPFTFYPDGIFMNLPVLSQFPDSPKTLEDLRVILSTIGGQVVVPKEAPDPRQYFLNQLNDLKERSQLLREELRKKGLFSIKSKSKSQSDFKTAQAVLLAKINSRYKVSVKESEHH